MKKNTLIVVGAGIKFMSHLTVETKASIEKSDKILYLLNDPIMEGWVKKVNPSSESLDFLYLEDQHRKNSYESIANYVLENLAKFKNVCLLTYGHPTVLDQLALITSNKAIEHHFNVIILPAISAEDCLYADLKIDPRLIGCQSFEATDFLVYRREYDTSCHLMLWQASVIGVTTQPSSYDPRKGLSILVDYLSKKYNMNHEIIIYEAAQYPKFNPKIEKVFLKHLPDKRVSRKSILYIPPSSIKIPDEDMIKKIKNLF